MEMESSRRSIDRSREPGGPGLKKPRLSEEAERDRTSNGVMDRGRSSFPQRLTSSSSSGSGGVAAAPSQAASLPLLSRVRVNDRERDVVEKIDPSPFRGVQQQQQQQQQQVHSHQELVSQYKSALAELTFNSKPIITNLTIIAGENLHAAKWIAATVCANIIEVPSDQKLPSLYLLDSIVKNIGRDYIRYFAAKLPEVFSKAYRQVDSTIHSGMRHLFGTWKGVFPPACLQMIDKELGFTPAINGSSSGTQAAKPEIPSQRPAHSIHVNPKYLEARQRLQQSSRAKETNDDMGTVVAPVRDAEVSDGAAALGRGKSWTKQPVKLQDPRRPQREALSEPVREKKANAVDEGIQYESDLSRRLDLGNRRLSERITERGLDKSWYGAGGNLAESAASLRTAFNSQHGLANYRTSISPQSNTQLKQLQNIPSRSSGGMAGSWKNSEEEEYLWDDMSSRLTDRSGPDNLRKDRWTPDDTEMPEFEDGLRQPYEDHDGPRIKKEASADLLSTAPRRQGAFGHRTSSIWPVQDIPSGFPGLSDSHPTSLSGLTSMSSSLVRAGLQSLQGSSVSGTSTFGSLVNSVSGSVGVFGQQRQQPLRPASPSGQSPMHQLPYTPLPSGVRQHQESHNSINQDQSHNAGQLNRASHLPSTQDSISSMPQSLSHLGNMRNRQTSSSLASFSQLSKHGNSSHLPHQDMTLAQSSSQTSKPYPPAFGTPEALGASSVLSHSNDPPADLPGQLSKGSLLAAIMKSGLFTNNSATGGFPSLGSQDSALLASNSNLKPPLPTGPPPTQFVMSSPMPVPAGSASEQASHGSTSSLTIHHKSKAVLPPLPPGPPPTSSIAGNTLLQTSNVANAVPNPLSSLLNSLVVKGLISSPATESPNVTAPQLPIRADNQSYGVATSSSVPASSTPDSSIFPLAEIPYFESAAKSSTGLSGPMKADIKDVIGIEFKPEVIRESHPSVISSLFDFPHKCSICNLGFKAQERLESHMGWHAAKSSVANSGHEVSQNWYLKGADWIPAAGKSSSAPMPAATEMTVKTEESEPVVLADESQCVCLLCGELFQDFYCHERGEWMYKGAVHMRIPAREGENEATDGSTAEGPIVHTNCILPSSVYDLGLAKSVKMEPVDE